MDLLVCSRPFGAMTAAHYALGLRIHSLRKERGLAQEACAELAGISRAHFGKIERGEVDFSLSKLLKIAKVLNVEASLLLEGLDHD